MRRSALVLTSALLLGFGALLGLVVAGWAPLLSADHRAVLCVNRAVYRDGGLLAAARALSLVFYPDVLRVIGAVAAVVLAARRSWRLAAIVGTAVLASIALSSTIKVAVGRPRPAVPHVVGAASGASFPSGHALTSLLLLGLLAVLVVPRLPRVPGAALLFVVVAAVGLVGASRLVLGVHYPSDVIGGWLLAGAALAALTAVVPSPGVGTGGRRPADGGIPA